MHNEPGPSCPAIKAMRAAPLGAAENTNWTATVAVADQAGLATLDQQR
jgi:hypothetical protein